MGNAEFSREGLAEFKRKYGLENVYFHDWNHGPIYTLKNDEEKVSHSLSLEALCSSLTKGRDGHVFEVSYSSFDTEYRKHFEERARSLGHKVFGVVPQTTEKTRRRLGVKKTDFNDVRIIRFIVCEQRHHVKLVKPYNEKDLKFFDKHALLCKDLMDARRKKIARPIKSGKNKGAMKMVSLKELFGKAIKQLFPKYSKLPADVKNALGSGTNASNSAYATLAHAAMNSDTRAEYERILRLSEHGRRSIFSSDVLYHNLRHKLKKGITKSDWRRGIRAFYHMIKDLQRKGIVLPVMGITVPSA